MKPSTIIWIGIAWLATVALALILLILYIKPATIHTVTNTHTVATAAVEVIRVPTEKLVIEKCVVHVYPAETKVTLGIDDKNPATRVVAASLVESSRYDKTVTTLLDSETGVFNTLVRAEPLPRWRLKPSGYAGIGIGIKPDTGATVRLLAGADFLQLKSWHIGAAGTLDSDGATFFGGQAVRRF